MYCTRHNSLLNKLDLCMKEVLWLIWQVMFTSGQVPVHCCCFGHFGAFSKYVSHCLLCWLPYFWGAFKREGAFSHPSYILLFFQCVPVSTAYIENMWYLHSWGAVREGTGGRGGVLDIYQALCHSLLTRHVLLFLETLTLARPWINTEYTYSAVSGANWLCLDRFCVVTSTTSR